VIVMPVADEVSNTPLIANARMYSSGAPEAAAAWTSLLNWVVTRAGCGFEVLDYPPPRPLDAFWARADLGCAFMCGLPYARDPRPLTPIVAPVVRGARDIVDALLAGRIDVGPLDSYVHDLIRNLQPATGAQLRTIATTRASPIPLFVATAPIGPDLVGKLQAAFKAAARADALEAERDMLLIADFVVPERAVYEALRARAEAAAAYPDAW